MGIFRYTVVIEWDLDERAYVANVPALPVSTYGETRQDALRQAKDAIEATIEGLRAAGQPVPAGDGATVETVEVNV